MSNLIPDPITGDPADFLFLNFLGPGNRTRREDLPAGLERRQETPDGNEYPVVYVDISSASHPFYTGKQQFVDTMGRVEKFRKKFAGKYGKDKKK